MRQRSKYKEDFRWSDDVTPQKKMFRAPNQYGYFALNYTPIKPLTLSLTGNYTGSMLVQHSAGYIIQDEENETPDFFDMGLRIAYDITLSRQVKLQLSGGVKNIFDQFQKDIDRGTMKDGGYIYGPATPRMFYLGAKISM
ncbi:TonB-dependent receptor [Bacteroidales bacterium OttesenSCG-928-I14]|nr:TonB-dependent receptor [Bacteroidales bacterium OttesenSCG-928-I14]